MHSFWKKAVNLPKIIFFHKRYITCEKVKIIKITFLFSCLQAECLQGSQLQCFKVQMKWLLLLLLLNLKEQQNREDGRLPFLNISSSPRVITV